MIKRVSLVQRQPGASRQEFLDHWTGPHVEIMRGLPGLRGMRLGIVETSWTPGGVAWDGVGELWFDSIEDARRAFDTQPWAELLTHDRAQFLGPAESCFVRERTVVSPPTDRG